MPSPLAGTLVKATGAVPSHIVCSDPIDPGTKFTTVTLMILLSSVHVPPGNVDVNALLNHASVLSEVEAYVAAVAPTMSVKTMPLVLSCH